MEDSEEAEEKGEEMKEQHQQAKTRNLIDKENENENELVMVARRSGT